MRTKVWPRLVAAFFVVSCLHGSVHAQVPVEDTGFTAATPRPDPDLVVVRERVYGVGGVDLTSYGIGVGPVDYIQSLYFRFFVDNDSSEDATAGRVVLPAGVEVLGFIVDGDELGGSVDDMIASETDAIFGVADPDVYSEQSRGFGVGGGNAKDEFVCTTAPDRFVFGLNVTTGVDDFRVIVDYGDSFPQDLTMDIASYNLGTLGGVPVEPGIQIGNIAIPGVPGSGDFGESGSVLGVPLTATTQPQAAFDLPFRRLQNVYLVRDTTGPTRIDAFDVIEQLPWPTRSILDVRVQNPAAMTDGPDGLLYAIGLGGGYAGIDPVSGLNTQLLLEDHVGENVDLTNLPGTRDLYVVRDTTGHTEIDRLDVDSPSFVPAFTITAAVLPDPAAITDAADGLLYVVGSSGNLVPVDPVTGPQTPVSFGAPVGGYVSITGVSAAEVVYLLRDAGNSAIVDRFDIGTGVLTFDFATIAVLDDAVSITDAVGGRLALIGRGQNTAPWYVELDAATGVEIASNICLDFSGSNVSITDISEDNPATPGEAGTYDQPILVTGYDGASGELSLLYGVACEATNHTIHFGPLSSSDLATYNYTGRNCGIGNTGFYEHFAPGAGAWFFVVVADDGAAQGSYGKASDLSERPPDSANPDCGLPQDLSDSCAGS